MSAEYVIEDTIATEMNMMDMNGRMVPVKCLGAFVIRHKGNPVSVGSGFTAEQRIEFLKMKRSTSEEQLRLNILKRQRTRMALPVCASPFSSVSEIH